MPSPAKALIGTSTIASVGSAHVSPGAAGARIVAATSAMMTLLVRAFGDHNREPVTRTTSNVAVTTRSVHRPVMREHCDCDEHDERRKAFWFHVRPRLKVNELGES